MKVEFGKGKTEYGPGVNIHLTGDEVATAIYAYLVAQQIHVDGARTVSINGELCNSGKIYVDPAGSVIIGGSRYTGRGEIE